MVWNSGTIWFIYTYLAKQTPKQSVKIDWEVNFVAKMQSVHYICRQYL